MIMSNIFLPLQRLVRQPHLSLKSQRHSWDRKNTVYEKNRFETLSKIYMDRISSSSAGTYAPEKDRKILHDFI